MLPNDYAERLYAGVLGKIIGVYLGRPFEGATYENIMEELGEIWYYVHEKRGVPLIVTDDDISGTFTFLRALPDFGNSLNLTSEQIGKTWMNYLVENRTVLWWGGMGNSTEHTAYLRLKKGVPAPHSGSSRLNGKVVSEQIGAQIFIDGWAMVYPGEPDRAAELARKAAMVSHDGEAVYGAQVIAAMEALAFVEKDLNQLLNTAIRLIPGNSIIYRLISDLREWHSNEPDWRKTRDRIVANYGYDRYGGNCHIVPNHALIHLGLLYGEDNFQKTLMITNTSGWDTDCNSGNVGCLMGIKNGLNGIDEGVDWRGPVADRMYLPTADGGRSITDAVQETFSILNISKVLHGEKPLSPKNGSRFHFELPGSVQGFTGQGVTLENIKGHSKNGLRSLALYLKEGMDETGAQVRTSTFIPPSDLKMGGYGVMASPTLYPGQTIKARLEAEISNHHPLVCRLFISAYGSDDRFVQFTGPDVILEPGKEAYLEWTTPLPFYLIGMPIAEVGLEVSKEKVIEGARIYLDYLTWDGCPSVILKRPEHNGTAWRSAWINGVDHFQSLPETYRLIQDEGRGLLIQGCREWKDYQVSADISPHMVKSAGIAARVQGMRRYYAFLLCEDGKARLIKMNDYETILAEKNTGWRLGDGSNLSLKIVGNHLTAYWDGFVVFDCIDHDEPFLNGAIALVVEEGRTSTGGVSIFPVISDEPLTG